VAREELAYATDFERASAINREDPGVSTRELWSLWRRLRHLTTGTADEGSESGSVSLLRALTPAQRRRLAIKAMDLVLFGPPKKAHSIVKDGLLALLLVIILAGSWLVLVQRQFFEDHRLKEQASHRSRSHWLPGSQSDSTGQSAQGHVTVPADQSEPAGLQDKLEQAEQEVSRLRVLLDQTARLQQPVGFCGAGGAELQHLLQLSYETELRYCNANRLKAEEQLLKASEGAEPPHQEAHGPSCRIPPEPLRLVRPAGDQHSLGWLDRLKRKQYSVIGLLRNAFDSAEMVDIVEQDIVRLKFADKVKLDIQERLQRWSRIEQLIGFSIILPEPEQGRGLNIRPYANLWRRKTAEKFKRSATHASSLFAKHASSSSMHELML
uniref:SOAR domain-containing protein n=1 Tax=Macrostomum lignano TaxID=282301 RepID=A0A1I8JNC4_9PLAT